jgi:hypothetical protein
MGVKVHARMKPSLPALVAAFMTVPVVMHAGLNLTFHTVAGGVTITGSGTNDASMTLGTVSKYGSIGPDVTRTLGGSDYTMSTLLGVRVTKDIGDSTTTYTLRARLLSSSVLTWKVNDITLTTSLTTVASTQAYATTYSHTMGLLIADSQTTGLNPVPQFEFVSVPN